eukprot:1113349-Rhodomonas_salina.1
MGSEQEAEAVIAAHKESAAIIRGKEVIVEKGESLTADQRLGSSCVAKSHPHGDSECDRGQVLGKPQ